jgi:hypothetical protein
MNELTFNKINADKMVDLVSCNGSCCATTAAIATNLPTAKEYSEMVQKAALQFTAQWSEPKYQCPKCGGGMRKNLMVVLTSYPVKYEYCCDKCGYVDYQFI